MGQDDSFDDDFNQDINDIIKEKISGWKKPTELDQVTETEKTQLKKEVEEKSLLEQAKESVEGAEDNSSQPSSSETTQESDESSKSSDASVVAESPADVPLEETKPEETKPNETELERRKRLRIDLTKPLVEHKVPESDPSLTMQVLQREIKVKEVVWGDGRTVQHIEDTVKPRPAEKIMETINSASDWLRIHKKDLVSAALHINKVEDTIKFLQECTQGYSARLYEMIGTATEEEQARVRKIRSRGASEAKPKAPKVSKPRDPDAPSKTAPEVDKAHKASVDTMVKLKTAKSQIVMLFKMKAERDEKIAAGLAQILLYIEWKCKKEGLN